MSILVAYDALGRGLDMSATETGGGFFYNDSSVSAVYLGSVDYDTIVYKISGMGNVKYMFVSGTINLYSGDAVISEIIYSTEQSPTLAWGDMRLLMNVNDSFDGIVFYSILNGPDYIYGNNYSDTIKSGSGDDAIYGLAGADFIFGESGGDLLVGGSGNDSLDGGPGLDVAVYSGVRANYVVTVQSGRPVSVQALSGDEGVDILTNIEVIRFSDGDIFDFSPRVISVSNSSSPIAEGRVGGTAFTFTVTRSGDVSEAASASWSVAGSGANPANALDFANGVLPSGTVNFAATEASNPSYSPRH